MKQTRKLKKFLQFRNLIGYKLTCLEGPHHTESNDRAMLQTVRRVMIAWTTRLTSMDSSEEKALKLLGSFMVSLKST